LSEIDNIVVLAGQNESGKTAVLEALNFFRNGPNQDFERLQIRLDAKRTEVVCKFTIEEDDLRRISAPITDDQISKFIHKNSHISFVRLYENQRVKNIELIDESASLLKSLLTEQERKPPISETPPKEPSDEELPEEDPATPEPAPEPKPPSPEKLLIKVKSELVDAIPPFSLYSTFTDLLPSEIVVTELDKTNAIKDFEKVFTVNLADFAQIDDPRQKKIKQEEIERLATDDFNESWTQTIASVKDDKKYTFSIETSDAEPKKIVFMIKGRDDTPLYHEQKSMGFRWFSAFHLRLRALMKDELPQDNKSKDKNRFILLIDEPGQNLHDIAQRDVKKILEETSGKGVQIIYSTHNPNLIGIEGKEFTRIRLVSNDEELGTKVENVAQFISKPGRGSLDALSPIRTAMGLVDVQPFFDVQKLNVVVEGITDHYYLSAFQNLLNKDERIRFLPACGVDNVKHLVSVLIGWGYNYKAVFDDDPKQGRKAYNLLKKNFYENNDALAHEHIHKIKDCHGIEDVFIQTDFENLVIGRTKKPDEKQKKNSTIVKEFGKVICGRMFLEKVEKGEKVEISQGTQKNVEAIFSWLYEKFGLAE